MIWGSQYDQIMHWMQENEIDVTSITPIEGAKQNNENITGSSENDKLNNVYDLIGCGKEYTAEGAYARNRTNRGAYAGCSSHYGYGPNRRHSDATGNLGPTYNAGTRNSSRLTLYIK